MSVDFNDKNDKTWRTRVKKAIADVNAEEDRAKAAEQVLTDNLAQEVTNRTNADTTLNTKIDDTKTALQKEIDDDVKVETTNRTNADSVLDGKISSETTRASEEEGKLSKRIETIEGYDIDNRANELKSRLDTLDNQNLNTRITALEDLNLSSVIELVNQLQSKITKIETTIEELKAYHPVEEPEPEPEPEEPEIPTEPTE